MKKNILLLSVVATLISSASAFAEEVKPDNEVSFNASLASDYRYRGISQTRLDPALQGGADYTNNPTGLYAGTWLSTIKWISDTPGAGSTPAEWDIYAGKKGEVTKDVSYDIGVLAYVYVNNNLTNAGMRNGNTLELYGQLGYGPAYIKYSHAVTPLFGIVDSKNSGYLDAGANINISEGLTLNLHVGYQKVQGTNSSAATYTDYKVGVSKELKQFGDITVSLAAIGTNANQTFYASPANGKFLGKTSAVLIATKTF
ncbi:TorF family putative porin [Undibacterium sp. RuRC25W]|uniref:TorF family putative porin n=1 Tax=Undibacterium sp. RuRC25W TaxID=3413047 RepID=UPI003BF082AA